MADGGVFRFMFDHTAEVVAAVCIVGFAAVVCTFRALAKWADRYEQELPGRVAAHPRAQRPSYFVEPTGIGAFRVVQGERPPKDAA